MKLHAHEAAGAVLVLILLAAGATQALAGNGMRSTGASLKQISRGGTFVATDPDSGALSGNPAALAFLERPVFDFDLRLIESEVKYTGVLNGRGRKRSFWAPNLAYAAPGSEDFAWGLGVFSLSNLGYEVQDFDLSLIGAPAGTRDSASSSVRYLALTPGIAVKLSEDTAIGASLHWSSGETDDQSYSILANTSGQELSGLAGSGYAWRAGLLHRFDDATQLGLYYRSRSHLTVDGGTISFAPGNPLAGQSIENVEVDGAEFPEEYGLGIQHRFDCRFRASAEYRHIGWAAVRRNITISPPGIPAIVFPQNWKDQNVLALGAEFSPRGDDEQVWRAGLNYAASPIRDEFLSPIFAATNELHYSLGYEQQLSEEWRGQIGASYSPANVQTSTASNPYNATFGAGQPFSAGTPLWEFGFGLSWSPSRKDRACEECGECSDCGEDDCACHAEEAPDEAPPAEHAKQADAGEADPASASQSAEG
ncbi:outer membrane protein transport protein [bacterium]|nr:outer membrane protein transport protein [bacterium]